MRCVIRTLRNKILPLVLSVSLVLGLLVSSVLADAVYPSGQYSFDDIWNLARPNGSLGQAKFEACYEAMSENMTRDSNIFMALTNWNITYYGVFCWVSSSGYFRLYNNRIYVSEPNVTVIYGSYATNSFSDYSTFTSSSYSTTIIDETWYFVSNVSTSDINNSDSYSTHPITIFNSYYDYANLSYGTLMPDTRIFEVWKTVEYPESSNPLEYINVKLDGSVDLNKISTQKIRFDYSDADGNNLYKVFSEKDFHDIQYNDSEDYYTFYLFPYLISSYEYTITSSTYYSDLVEWAEKTIELDLTYNEGTIYPLPQDWNSVYTVNQYFSSRSNGTVNGGVTKLALSSTGLYWIDYNDQVCHQVFDVKALFIPYFMNSDLLSINLETLFQLYEQYDVIFTGVQPTQFNLLLPLTDYNDLFVYYSQNGFYPALQKLQEEFPSYSNLKFDKDLFDYSWTLSPDDVGFIVTRSFLLKRTLTALGDVDNRLLEFETNLVGEDSLGASLQTKLDNILSLEHDFFTDVSNFFQKLEYNLNGMSLGRIEKYLEDIWSATVGERNFNYTDLLPEPLKSIFLYFRGWFISSTQYMQDFIDVSNSSLYGDDLMKLPFEATVVPVLPFEPGTPTPIPIPTLEAGLIEVGGD